MPNSSSSSNSSMNQAVPESQQGGQIASATMIETPAGGASADVDVPGLNPDIDVNTSTSVTPDIGVSLTSDTTPMSGGTGMTMHQNSNGVFEAPDPVTPLSPGEDGVPVQPVPDSPPGGTIANQPPMAPNGGFGTKVQTASVPAEQNPGVSSNGDSVIAVPIEPTHYYRGGYGYNRGWYGPNRGGYYYGHGYYYGGGGPYYGYQPYGYYYYPSQGVYYY